MPLYCRKASAILSNSGLTTRDFVRLIGVPDRKITTVHLGTGRQYRVIEDMDQLEEKRRRFGLPRKFILSVIKYDPRKNFENLIAAFRLLRKQQPCKLVVTGIGCEKYIREYGLDSDGTSEDVHFLGWVDQEDLPYLYNMARCLFFPSVYEEFGIPTCEAMACGCPPVVSNTGALPEIAGKAGMIVDPFQPEEMCGALSRLWNNDQIYNDLRQRCLCRAPTFTWENCAAKTLEVLTSIQEN
jgi:glycosyltransferase involved in cell wall biosynthesis